LTAILSFTRVDEVLFTYHEGHYSLKDCLFGHIIIFKPLTVSTNDDVIGLGQRGFDEGTVVVADAQLMGRGRRGRTWHSPAGANLYFSVLLRPPFMLKHGYAITMMAAISVVSAIEQVTDAQAFIKWPNDIMMNGKKTGGILTEVKSHNNRIKFTSLGIGVNVNSLLTSLPLEVREKATSLKIETGQHISRKHLLFSILREIEKFYKVLKNDGIKSVFNIWRKLCNTPGSFVSISTVNGIIRGHAVDVGDCGELLIKSETGELQKITTGDVALLRA
jgi:BirA family biotin operon repressor/biotin-[acetyl-CoA-carboxylase] ligase